MTQPSPQQPGHPAPPPSYPQPYPPYSPPYLPAYVRPAMSAPDERTWAMLSHLAPFAGSFLGLPVVGPLVVYLVHRDRSPFVRRHASAALNFQIMLLIVFAVGFALAIPLTLLTAGIALLVALPLGLFVAVAAIVLQVVGAVAASRGQDFQYPLTPRFVS